ncbi:MAG: hypothetical protein V1859_06415 [archaeon]
MQKETHKKKESHLQKEVHNVKETNWKIIAVVSIVLVAALSVALTISVITGVKNCRLSADDEPLNSLPNVQTCPLPGQPSDNPPAVPDIDNSVQEIPTLKELPEENTVLISKEEYEKAKNAIIKDYYSISSQIKRLHVGENFIFGFAVKNLDYKAHRFRPTLTIDRVEVIEGNLANKAHYNEDTMKSWVDTSFFKEFTLNSNEYTIIPLSLTVGEKKGAGDPTIPAGYYFIFKTEVYNEKDEKWEPYHDTAKKILYIRVE